VGWPGIANDNIIEVADVVHFYADADDGIVGSRRIVEHCFDAGLPRNQPLEPITRDANTRGARTG